MGPFEPDVQPVHALAPAKVNPWLNVLHRRADGFHELETSMLALDLYDVVSVRPRRAEGIELSVIGPFASQDVPRDRRNLVVRAAEGVLALARLAAPERALPPGLALELTKNIPSQSGLGGASSDAAATFAAVAALQGVELDAGARAELLGSLGSDCVFFAEAAATGMAHCKGRGEQVQPVVRSAPGWSIALLTPQARCPTAQVYRALELPLSAPARVPTVRASLFAFSAEEARACLCNTLEVAARKSMPEISEWRRVLDAAGAGHFLMSGSGSSFFGLFDDPAEAGTALEEVARLAHRRGLELRGAWVTRPSGCGARLFDRVV